MQLVQIEERVKATLAEFVEDWGLDTPITNDTTLADDLEFDSIDVIQFVVAVETAFGTRNMGFQELLMQDGRYVDDLSVGQIVSFLQNRFAKAS